MLRKLLVIVLIFAAPLQAFNAVASEGGHLYGDNISHFANHENGVAHHHEDDGSVHHDSSDESLQHLSDYAGHAGLAAIASYSGPRVSLFAPRSIGFFDPPCFTEASPDSLFRPPRIPG